MSGSESKKPREWWILEYDGPRVEDGDLILGEVLNPETYPGEKPLVHVIEKSAYDALGEKLKEIDHHLYSLEHMKRRYEESGKTHVAWDKIGTEMKFIRRALDEAKIREVKS